MGDVRAVACVVGVFVIDGVVTPDGAGALELLVRDADAGVDDVVVTALSCGGVINIISGIICAGRDGSEAPVFGIALC